MSFSGQIAGSTKPLAEPSRCGPRHCGYSCACRTAAADKSDSASVKVGRTMLRTPIAAEKFPGWEVPLPRECHSSARRWANLDYCQCHHPVGLSWRRWLDVLNRRRIIFSKVSRSDEQSSISRDRYHRRRWIVLVVYLSGKTRATEFLYYECGHRRWSQFGWLSWCRRALPETRKRCGSRRTHLACLP